MDVINVRDGYPIIIELRDGRKILSVGKNWMAVNKKNDFKDLYFKAYRERYGNVHLSTIEKDWKDAKSKYIYHK